MGFLEKVLGDLFGKKKGREEALLESFPDSEIVFDVHNFYQLPKIEAIITGKLLRGSLASGMRLKVLPSGKTLTVKYLEADEKRIPLAVEGQLVGIGADGLTTDDVKEGSTVVNAEAQPSRM